MPHFGLPFQPQLQENHHVEVCPFSFEERDRERRALKEKKLEEKRSGEVGVCYQILCPLTPRMKTQQLNLLLLSP